MDKISSIFYNIPRSSSTIVVAEVLAGWETPFVSDAAPLLVVALPLEAKAIFHIFTIVLCGSLKNLMN